MIVENDHFKVEIDVHITENNKSDDDTKGPVREK